MYTYDDLEKKSKERRSSSEGSESTDISLMKKRLVVIEPEYSVGKCLREIFVLALPTILLYLTFALTQTINLIFINNTFVNENQKKNCVNAIGIITLFIQVTVTTLYYSLLAALDVVGSNAYALKKYDLLGIYLQKTQIIVFATILILASFLYAFAIPIIGYFGIEKEVLEYSQEYMNMFLLALIFDAQFYLCVQFLNIIERPVVNIFIMLIMLLLHPLWAYIFIYKLNLGATGAGLCMLFTNVLGTVIGTVYVYVIKPLPEAIFWYSKKTFEGYCRFLKFTVSNAVSLVLEMWAIEVFGVIAVWLGGNNYVIYVIYSNVYHLTFSITFGIGISMLILVSRNISNNYIKTLKKVVKITLILECSFLFVSGLICLILAEKIIGFYIDDPKLIKEGQIPIRLLSFYIFLDMGQYICGNIFKGLGDNLIPFVINLCNFYVVQVAIVIILGKVFGYGVVGIVVGMCIGHFIATTIYILLFIFYADTHYYYEETVKRIEADAEVLVELEDQRDVEAEIGIIDDEETCKLNNKLS